MARHRGTYKKDHPEPYEVSRSQIQSFLNCPACFWMNRSKGIKFPGMPGFLLNTATDTLLKKDFDVLQQELIKYNPELADKDFMIAFSKCDLMDDELLGEFEIILKKEFKSTPFFIISSVRTFSL